jgi:hypothetical protein
VFAGQRFVQQCKRWTQGVEPVVRKGIVTHSAVRIAAGAGVVAASLLIVGPNPADAAADKQGHSDSSSKKKNSNGQSGSAKRTASNVVKDVINGISTIAGIDNNSKPDLTPPKMNLGTSGDTAELFTVESVAPEGQSALRSAAVAEAPVGDNVAAAAAPGGGSDYAGSPAAAFRAPQVTFGNGRTPGTNVAEPPASLTQVPDASAVPTAIEIDIPPLPPPLPPVAEMRPAELVVGEFGMGTADTVTDPLAGVAGLILLPAVGAVLGYRQARAAQSLRDSVNS